MEDRKTDGQQFFSKEDDRNGIDNEAFLQENITKEVSSRIDKETSEDTYMYR